MAPMQGTEMMLELLRSLQQGLAELKEMVLPLVREESGRAEILRQLRADVDAAHGKARGLEDRVGSLEQMVQRAKWLIGGSVLAGGSAALHSWGPWVLDLLRVALGGAG
jgi:hypothetical protein